MQSLISFSLGFYCFAALQGGLYFMKNRLQEAGIAAALAMYLFTAAHSAFSVKNIRWNWWALGAPMLSVSIIVTYGLVFTVNTGQPPFPSMAASRYFLLMFIVPVIYFLYRLGYPIKDLERILVITMVLLLFNYLFHYNRIDRQAAYFSSDHTISALVSYDDWRGFRLKAPTYVVMILLLSSAMRLFQGGRAFIRVGCLVVFGLSFFVLYVNMTRAAMGSVMIAVLWYPIFFSRPNRINLFLIGLPLGLMAGFAITGLFLQTATTHLASDWSFIVRMKSWKIAWDSYTERLIFGYGQASYYSLSFQDIFGPKFFPSDLGLVGVAFKYGSVGVGLYLFFNIYLIYRLMMVNWIYRKRNGRHNPLIWAMFILVTSLLINIVLQPAFVFAPGLTLASIAVAYTACYYEEYGLARQYRQYRSRFGPDHKPIGPAHEEPARRIPEA